MLELNYIHNREIIYKYSNYATVNEKLNHRGQTLNIEFSCCPSFVHELNCQMIDVLKMPGIRMWGQTCENAFIKKNSQAHCY